MKKGATVVLYTTLKGGTVVLYTTHKGGTVVLYDHKMPLKRS